MKNKCLQECLLAKYHLKQSKRMSVVHQVREGEASGYKEGPTGRCIEHGWIERQEVDKVEEKGGEGELGVSAGRS